MTSQEGHPQPDPDAPDDRAVENAFASDVADDAAYYDQVAGEAATQALDEGVTPNIAFETPPATTDAPSDAEAEASSDDTEALPAPSEAAGESPPPPLAALRPDDATDGTAIGSGPPADTAATDPIDEPVEDAVTDAARRSVAPTPVPADYADESPQSVEEEPALTGPTGGGWTIPLLCAGVAVLACCAIIPQADANRRLAHERAALRQELESVQAQVATNDEFLRKLATDPQLAERLAQRQMKMIRAGTKVLPIVQGPAGGSPFDLVQVPPPAWTEPYRPVGGRVASLCYDPRTRVYLMGGGLFLLAAGLVLGAGGRGEYVGVSAGGDVGVSVRGSGPLSPLYSGERVRGRT